MKLHSLLKFPRRHKIGAFFFVQVSVAFACAPDFPNCYLALPATAMLAAPEGFFAVEIDRIAPAQKFISSTEEAKAPVREADELREALIRRGESAAHADKMVKAYKNCRTQQRQCVDRNGAACSGDIPIGLPPEFAHYLEGAKAWYENDIARARAEWQEVLALPMTERNYRSTWAAYMLGRSTGGDFPSDEARSWFAETRRLAQAGFADSINLAGASYGIEAGWAMEQKDFCRAIAFYLDQYATGDTSAYQSLRMAAAAAAKSNDQKLKGEMALEPRVRRVLTAWFLARFASEYGAEPDEALLRAWTVELVAAEVKDIEHADRLAWLAYEAGDFDLAKTWAALALDTSGETHWIRAKLALRDNRLCVGAKELGLAAETPTLAAIYRSTVLGELGRVQLALDHREAALTAWLDGAHWEDAAYVAERLLTIDELKIFYATYCPARRPLYEPYHGEVVDPESIALEQVARPDFREKSDSSLRADLAELLARRLVRVGRVGEAKPYFCPKHQLALAAYVADVQCGFNLTLRPKKRAAAFWRAAMLIREEGMDLMGAELQPDFAIWDGAFCYFGAAEDRLKMEPGPFSPTEEEGERLAAIPIPAKRFSYRYRAADLAWWAAALLPNDSDETAEILNTAGGWLKGRDPIEANRFYQALVIRCGHTKIGKAAAEKHWFPDEI